MHVQTSAFHCQLVLNLSITGEEPVAQPIGPPVVQDGGGSEIAAAPEFPEVSGPAKLAELASQIPGLVVLNVHIEDEGWDSGVDGVRSEHVPIHELTGAKALEIAAAPSIAVVAGQDHRTMQACLRLSRVYKAQRVYVYCS